MPELTTRFHAGIRYRLPCAHGDCGTWTWKPKNTTKIAPRFCPEHRNHSASLAKLNRIVAAGRREMDEAKVGPSVRRCSSCPPKGYCYPCRSANQRAAQRWEAKHGR